MRFNVPVRLWSIHPSLLDRRALVACWREGLLAQKVLRGETKGYTRHPQLERFRATPDPLGHVAAYLHGIADEADRRKYTFDRDRIRLPRPGGQLSMPVTHGQLEYEFRFLRCKVEGRDPQWARALSGVDAVAVAPHPLFHTVAGPVASWERVKETSTAPARAPDSPPMTSS